MHTKSIDAPIKTIASQAPFSKLSQLRGIYLVLSAIIIGIGIGVLVKYFGLWALLSIPILFVLVGAFLLPEVGLPVFVFVIYINLSANMITFYGLPSIAKSFVALLSLVLFVRVFFLGQEVRGLKTPLFLLGMYTMVGATTLIYMVDFNAGYVSLVEYLKIAYYSILVVAFIQKPSTFYSVIWALLFAGILMGTISLFQYFTGTTENIYWGFGQSYTSDTGTGYRVGGPVGDPNYYAMIMVILVPIAFDRLWNSKSNVLRFFSGWALVVCVLAVLYTYSRGGFLAMAFGVIIMAVYYKLRLTPAMLGIVFFLIIYQFLPANYTDRLSTLLYFLPQDAKQQLVDRSIQGRTSENLAAWEMFKDHPLTGVGMSNYENLYYTYARPLGLDVSVGSRQPHNLYLQILAERGLLGLSAFAIVMYVTFRNLYFSRRAFLNKNLSDLAGMTSSIGMALVIYLFASLFLHDSFIRYFWILIGVAWSIPQLAHDENEINEETTPSFSS